ncbi:hypothetical protein TNCT_256381 [Trichonephila clavata]|uniref:Uncharacterized protein n=1 Tax=Trichonephila clavata TaxID=2740835 RepID=A0A8X6KFX5_TRICU|nr:hypothetical protein TNCT_256381 [Trichonephila clavata]
MGIFYVLLSFLVFAVGVQSSKEIDTHEIHDRRTVHELEKSQKRLEREKEKLQEEEFENPRKNSQRVINSTQASVKLEAEDNTEALRTKKLKSYINTLEIALGHAIKAIAKARKNHEEYQMQHSETQQALEEEQRARDEVREQYATKAGLKVEAKSRTEALRTKRRSKSEINRVEIALDLTNKANVDVQKNIQKYQIQLKETQRALEEEHRARDEVREEYLETALDLANKANAEVQKSIRKYQIILLETQKALDDEQRALSDG